MSKDKKTFKAKIKAQNGQRINPWETGQNPAIYPQYDAKYPYPVDYYSNIPGSRRLRTDPATGENTYFQNRQDILNPWNQDYGKNAYQSPYNTSEITNDPLINMEFAPYNPSSYSDLNYDSLLSNSSMTESSKNQPGVGQQIGSIASGIGKAAGQAMNAITTGGPQLINALLPNQSLERIDRSLPRNYNPFPQGISGSQAIYEDGGYINPYTTRTRRQNNIVVTEEIPAYTENSFIPMEPIRELSQRPRTFNEVSVPTPIPARNISYDRMLDIQGNPTAYLPVFQGFSRNEAMQALPQLPEYTGGLPVIRSDYGDYFQNFMPGTTSDQWSPYDNQVQMFETGGSIHIDPAKKGSLRRALGVPEGQNIPLSDLEIKDTDSPSMIKKKTFARSARKWDEKQNGGFIQGDELDLTPSEVQQLLSQGYQIDIL